MENAGILTDGISVIGFDNILQYLNFPKPICSVDPHLKAEACTAIDLLRNRIHHPSLPPQQVILPVSLACREH
jgi:DNA-binding LacI/PurR family transcriptional regulator